MDFTELLRNRRSTRIFKEQKIETEKIEALQKAALMSPSGKRINEWEFIFVQDKETLQKLSLVKDHGSELLAGAALGIVVLADKTKSDIWIEDAAISATILQLQAEALGLGSCWVQCRLREREGVSAEENVRKILNLPDNFAVECIVAVGYKNQDRKPYEFDKLPYEKIHNEKL